MSADEQAARDVAHAANYTAWVATLPPKERARLAAHGHDKPDISRHVSRPEGDAITLATTASPESIPSEAATVDDDATAASNDHPNATAATIAHDQARRATADALAAFAARIRSHPNPLLALDALCVATGIMGVEGLSQTALAARHGVTPAAFSKLAVQFCDLFGLPPSRGMRSRRARQAHRDARVAYVAKHQHENEHAA